jgi:hypothetical protein
MREFFPFGKLRVRMIPVENQDCLWDQSGAPFQLCFDVLGLEAHADEASG